MKPILWLASWYPSRIAPYDGDFIQRHAKAAALCQPVHVVHVVKDEKGSVCPRLLVQEEQTGNLRETIIYYRPFKTGLRPADKLISSFTYYKVFRNYLKRHIKQHGKPPLVHLHVVMRAGPVALWLKRKYALPYLVTEHWTGYNPQAAHNFYTRNFLFRLMTRKILGKASLLLPVSKELGETITRQIQQVPYTVVYNVADTSVFNFMPCELPVFRFIHVSSMNYQKNIPGLLDAFSKLAARSGEWECLMIGPADDEVKSYSTELGLQQKLKWLGELSYREVARQLQQASALILFSRYENLPCVLVEAACCGLPVIAPRTGGIAEIVDEQNGILIAQNNGDELVQAMLQLMQHHHQYDRKKISDKAVGRFSYEKIGKEMASIYGTILIL